MTELNNKEEKRKLTSVHKINILLLIKILKIWYCDDHFESNTITLIEKKRS